MKRGQCPKCLSSDVYHNDESPLEAGEGFLHLRARPQGSSKALLLDAYLCASCGYLETYVSQQSRGKLTEVAKDPKWRKV